MPLNHQPVMAFYFNCYNQRNKYGRSCYTTIAQGIFEG
jgi:hypothetical protein